MGPLKRCYLLLAALFLLTAVSCHAQPGALLTPDLFLSPSPQVATGDLKIELTYQPEFFWGIGYSGFIHATTYCFLDSDTSTAIYTLPEGILLMGNEHSDEHIDAQVIYHAPSITPIPASLWSTQVQLACGGLWVYLSTQGGGFGTEWACQANGAPAERIEIARIPRMHPQPMIWQVHMITKVHSCSYYGVTTPTVWHYSQNLVWW